MKRCWDNDPEKRPMASEIYEVIQSWKNNYEILSKFDDFDVTIDDESRTVHSQAVYTSRFISHDELKVINSWTNGVIDDDNKIIESQEDNIPIEHMEKLMLNIDKAAE
ncbi:serine/threonine protein kinase [Gigaspora margarita]|uniref:Serine/threonine protein kinase n=1 Tax=Gigaspora margarita TaxID=4874 RepID=A0A8H4B1K5_GIGMA|nr:serine/threonine protein kinase [Gigaspora margarita]